MRVWDSTSPATAAPQAPVEEELVLRALVLGVRDYAGKCGFQRALLGLSGGIDSALVAVIAAAALGAENVSALLMPSPWSSRDRSMTPPTWRIAWRSEPTPFRFRG